MKYVIVLCDGMADFPIPILENKTPLEYAYIPNMHFLAKNGQVGKMKTIFENLPIESAVANMGILGYEPSVYYPNGRASFEALAQGIAIGDNNLAFRCNLISLNHDKIKDFTSANISDGHAKNLISHFKINNADIKIFPGQSYRNLLIVRNTDVCPKDIITSPPHMNIKKSIKDILPQGRTPESKKLAKILSELMLDSINQLSSLNKYYKTEGDMFWLWSPSSTPSLPNFYEKYNLSGSIVAALDFLKGIGAAANMNFEDVPDTNGYIDTSYENKLKYAIKSLETNDFVYIHINAPDEEGHNRNALNKVKSIENIDHKILGPLILNLREQYGNNFRLAILPDHYTAVKDGKHYGFDVPFLVYGKDIQSDKLNEFTEKEAAKSKFNIISYNFLNYFFKNNV